jgi:hypothetical protein
MSTKISQDELERSLRSYFGGASEPAAPPTLPSSFRRLPDGGRHGRSMSAIPALLVVGVIALAVLVVGVPLLAAKPEAQPGATAASRPSTSESASGLLEALATPDTSPDSTQADPFPSVSDDGDTTVNPTPGSSGGDPGWWQTITVDTQKQAYTSDHPWVKVVTPKPTQCTLIVYFTPDNQGAYGGFGATSTAPRYRTYLVPPDFSGTAYVEVSCWANGISGPIHTWKLPVTVVPGERPSTEPPSWSLTATAGDVNPGESVVVRVTVGADAMCEVDVRFSDGGANGRNNVAISAGSSTSFQLLVSSITFPGLARYTATCTDLDANSKSVVGTFNVLGLPTPLPTITIVTTDPPTAAPTDTPRTLSTDTPPSLPTDAPVESPS